MHNKNFYCYIKNFYLIENYLNYTVFDIILIAKKFMKKFISSKKFIKNYVFKKKIKI